MTPFSYLQNALILGAVFLTHYLTGTWWGLLWLWFWLSPKSS